MSGHSQFKNIMYRKGAQDKKRGKVFTKLIRELTTVHGINLAGVKVIFSLMEAAVESRLQIPESDFPELAGARHLWA